MKKNTILLGMSALMGFAMFSCTESWMMEQGAGGRISPLVGLDTDAYVIGKKTPSRAAVEITPQDLSIRLSRTDGSFEQTWSRLADFPVDQQFKVGEYKLEAYYSNPDVEGFESPSYYGSQTLTVVDGRTTSIGMTATLASSMFTIVYTDAFKEYMADWSATVTGAGAGITYAKDETRPVYVKPGTVGINVTVTKPNGLTATFALPNVEAEARHHYTVTVDVNNGNTGGGVLNITFDESLAQENVEIDISDKVFATPLPLITPEGFTNGSAVNVISGLGSAQYNMSLIADGGISEVMLRTSSAALQAQGWPMELDLMQATPEQKAAMAAVGFRPLGLWKNPGQMALLDFSTLVKNIKAVDGDNTSSFTVTLKDGMMRITEPMVFTVSVEEVNVQLSSADNYYKAGEDLLVNLAYNGNSVKDEVKIDYYNDNAGRWRPLEIKEAVKLPSRASADYRITLSAPEVTGNLKLRASAVDKVSPTVSVDPFPFELSATANDTYSTYSLVSVKGVNGNANPDITQATAWVKTASEGTYRRGTAAVQDGLLKVGGLTPGAVNNVKVEIAGLVSKAINISTEAGTPMPNGNMETWSVGRRQGSGWWEEQHPNATADNKGPWGTMNLLTTSEGSTGMGAPACGYSAKSGTSPVTGSDAHSGTSAMVMSVGWGGGNTAFAFAGWRGKCENTTPGELYLGTYNSATRSPNYGIAFNCRPASLSFYAKYVPKNSSDYGTVVMQLIDVNGKVMASYNTKFTANDTYQKYNIAFSYPVGAPKAARLVLSFKSSGNESCWPFSTSNYDTPPSANASTSRGYEGSRLFIDDITLSY